MKADLALGNTTKYAGILAKSTEIVYRSSIVVAEGIEIILNHTNNVLSTVIQKLLLRGHVSSVVITHCTFAPAHFAPESFSLIGRLGFWGVVE